jgi:hypothetical protein
MLGNDLIEAFWARMQVELLGHQHWRTPIELANAIFNPSRSFATGNGITPQ